MFGDGETTDISGIDSVEVELTHEGFYNCVCSEGHKFRVHLQEELFQMLFELATVAIADGYYREAVTSYTAALERFQEYALRVFCVANAVIGQQFEDAWKLVGSQSERQFGAYAFMHVAALHEPPPVLRQKLVEFRNQVVHKGHIPSAEKALEYGEAVRAILNTSLDKLRLSFEQEMDAVLHMRQAPNVFGQPPDLVQSWQHRPTIVTMVPTSHDGAPAVLMQNPRTLTDIVAAIKEARQRKADERCFAMNRPNSGV